MITTEIKWTPKKKRNGKKTTLNNDSQNIAKIRELEKVIDDLIAENSMLMNKLKEKESNELEHRLMITNALNEHGPEGLK